MSEPRFPSTATTLVSSARFSTKTYFPGSSRVPLLGLLVRHTSRSRAQRRLTFSLSVVAAFCCTRTDSELCQLLTPTLADRITACEEPFRVWAKRAWKTGARFDTVQWARKASFFTMGNMTFKEAYERTGRILNVSGAS
jgi:Flp pilus assembly secretin CpaC